MFNFLIGTEGSGHHMVRDILSKYLKKNNVSDQGTWHKILTDHWSKHTTCNYLVHNYQKKLYDSLNKELLRLNGIDYFFESASYPFNQPRDAIRHPDLHELINNIDKRIEVKALVLYRDPISVTYSAIKRGFTKNYLLQSKIIEANYLALMFQLSLIDKTKWKILRVQEFLESPKDYINGISSFWKIEKTIIEEGISRLKKPTQKDEIPKSMFLNINSFFTVEKIKLIDSFFSKNLINKQ